MRVELVICMASWLSTCCSPTLTFVISKGVSTFLAMGFWACALDGWRVRVGVGELPYRVAVA